MVRQKKFFKRKWANKRRGCEFCACTVNYISFRNSQVIQRLINFQGKILSSKITGTCASHQRMVSMAVKRARYMAIVPYSKPRVRQIRQISIETAPAAESASPSTA